MKSMTLRLVPVLALLSVFASAQATLQVPAQYPTIQAAIQAAQASDVVLVSPGTYFENLNLLGKSITIRSTQGAQATVVDGMNQNVTLRITAGQPRIEGLTLRNGRALLTSGTHEGGGVRITGGSPTLSDCWITQNVLTAPLCYGAGVYSTAASTTLERCRIVDNHCNSSGNGFGAGVAMGIFSSCVIRACLIQGNHITGVNASSGAGVHTNSTGFPNASIQIESTIFRDNHIDGTSMNSQGGGLTAIGKSIIRGCTFDANSAPIGGGAYLSTGYMLVAPRAELCRFTSNVASVGGGLYLHCPASGTGQSGAALTCCELRGNQATSSGQVGTAVQFYGGGIVMGGCLLALNTASGASGGAAIGITAPNINNGAPSIFNCTVANNTGAWVVHSDHPAATALVNCIVASNVLSPGGALLVGTVQAQHSLIPLPGVGNSSADPMFVNAGGGDFHLLPGSPGIDAGTPAAGSLDIDGDPRILGAAIDIGADEYHAPMQLLLDQPQGSGSARIRLQGGTAGHGAFTALSFDLQEPGWGVDTLWWGLWARSSDLIAQALSGTPPYVMTLDAGGNATWQIGAGTLPPLNGVAVHGVTVTASPSPFAWGPASAVADLLLY